MRVFTFSLMLVLQRIDDALQMERHKRRPDPDRLQRLRGRRNWLLARLRPSFRAGTTVGN